MKCAAGFVGLATLLVAAGATAAPTPHPSLLFEDITKTPGYQHRTQVPWSDWEKSILGGAKNCLSYDFSKALPGGYDRILYRGQFARDLALAYQITKDSSYAEKAKQALLNITKGSTLTETDRALGLRDYALAYDWIQPYLDAQTNADVRQLLGATADQVYQELTIVNGTQSNTYVSYSDAHGIRYPCVAVAGLVLADFTSTSLSSTPADWLKAGTDYLFVSDKLHVGNRSIFGYGFQESSGKHLAGAYKWYVLEEMAWWSQVYSHVTGKNLLEVYPAAKRAFTSEVWESMPNHYHNNYVTSGNTKETYHVGFLNLLDATHQSYVVKHLDGIQGAKLLQQIDSESSKYIPASLLYLVYQGYASVPRKDPPWTAALDGDRIYQVFRGSWAEDSDWLSLVTYNYVSTSNRDTAHHDQLSLEYYSRGDLLLADAGEVKKYLTAAGIDPLYGEYEVHHNGIAIEDPAKPFAASSWANSKARGFYKGDSKGQKAPASISNVINTSWMQLVDSSVTINYLVDNSCGISIATAAPIQYQRVVLYPESDYFVVVDRMASSKDWVFRNVFRPTSLSLNVTEDKNKDKTYDISEVGNVKLDLTVGAAPYDWLAKPYKVEPATGVTTSSVKWATVSPYGKQVAVHLYSVPASEVLVTKHVGRIAGYETGNLVFSPIVYLRTGQTKTVHRLTALLSRYASEKERTPTTLTVTGVGSAIQIASAGATDVFYSGSGSSSFGAVATDAETLFVRTGTSPTACTLLGGTKVEVSGAPLLSATAKLGHLSWRQDQAGWMSLKVKAAAATKVRIYRIDPSKTYTVKQDDAPFSAWTLENSNTEMVLDVPSGEHLYQIANGMPPVADSLKTDGPGPTADGAVHDGPARDGRSADGGTADARRADGAGSDGGGEPAGSSGCSCQVTSPAPGALVAAVAAMLVGLALWRSRRRAQARPRRR